MSSLLDALLLEEPTPATTPTPQEIYVALRRDGARGSGTINDPFEGGTRPGPALAATVTFDPKVAIAVCDVAHGFSSGNTLQVTNVTGESAGAYNRSFSGPAGEWASLSSKAFKVLLGSTPAFPPGPARLALGNIFASNGSPAHAVRFYWPVVFIDTGVAHGFVPFEVVRLAGLPNALLNGDFVAVTQDANSCWCLLTTQPGAALTESAGVTCAPVVHRFDQIMRTAPARSVIHLGPGVFETRGSTPIYNPSYVQDLFSVGFLGKTGQKLRGSGLSQTTLRLVHALGSASQVVALNCSAGLISHFEASDFTVDCNLHGQPVPGGIGLAPVTCGAVNLAGEFTRLRRLRAINWGCQANPECFVFGLSGSGQFPDRNAGNVIEDCIVEKPSENNTHETTLMNSAGTGAVVRHNYLNLEYANGFVNDPLAVVSITRDAIDHTLAHLTTVRPHTQLPKKNLVVRGAFIHSTGNPYHDLPNNPYNGVFAIEEIVSETELAYRMYADPLVDADVSGGATIGHGVSTEYVALAAVDEYQSADEWLVGDPLIDDFLVDEEVTITTKRPHHRTVGQTTNLLQLMNRKGQPTAFLASHSLFHRILKVGSTAGGDPLRPNRFTIPIPPELNTDWDDLRVPSAVLGLDFHGPAALSGTGCVTEGNSVYDCVNAFYTDFGGTRDLVVRNNYYSNIGAAVNFNLSAGSSQHGERLERDGTDHQIAIFTSESKHGYKEGDAVDVFGARIGTAAVPGGTSLDATYDGVFSILSASDFNFTYRMKNDPGANADPPTSITPISFRPVWQIHRLVYEGNICELYAYDGASHLPPNGVGTIAYFPPPPFAFPVAVFRENFFRLVNNAVSDRANFNGDALAFALASFRNTLVENNVIELADPRAINHFTSENVSGFNNLTPGGASLPMLKAIRQGAEYEREDTVEERIAAEINDAVICSML